MMRPFLYLYSGMHLISILACAAFIVSVQRIIPTGFEGGWLSRIYLGVLLGLSALGNLAFLVLSVLKRGMSAHWAAIRVAVLLSPWVLFVWAWQRSSS